MEDDSRPGPLGGHPPPGSAVAPVDAFFGIHAAIDARERADVHDEIVRYPREDWEHEVGEGDTNLGYWDWVRHQFEADWHLGDWEEGASLDAERAD